MAKNNEFKLKDDLSNATIAIEEGTPLGLFKAINAVKGELLKILKGTRSGKLRRKPGRKVKYNASKPGEAPATVEGTLRNSYETEMKKQGDIVYAILGSRLKYAPWLERGTRKMKPRPHLSVAFKRTQDKVQKIIAAELKKKMKSPKGNSTGENPFNARGDNQ